MPLISLLNNLYSAIDSSNFTPSAGSGQALRQAQDRPFGRPSGQALRQAQDKPFGRLRTSPSAGSGQAKNHLSANWWIKGSLLMHLGLTIKKLGGWGYGTMLEPI